MKLLFISILAIGSFAQADFLSAYTSVADKDCVLISGSALEKNPEIDYATVECPGLGGYQVMISGSDLRYPLQLTYQGKEITLSQMLSFHEVASDKIEWLYSRQDHVITYHALIHRLSVQVDEKSTEVLVVSKLKGADSCTVALVKGNSANQRARVIAEKASQMPCLNLNRE
ncbi:MAG: hypothetical protein H7061_13840 [Bdellovibrionaceae bacterium]|nr:hypothetical protein [Bdellovibrio sp.]